MSYNDKYILSYRDQLIEVGNTGRLTTVKIKGKDFAGEATEVKGSLNPIRLSGKTDDDYLFSSIVVTSCEIELMSEYSFQFISLFSADAREHLVEIWKEPTPGASQILWWTGYIIPDNYSEPLNYYENYIVRVVATDNLSRLKEYPLENTVGLYEGKVTIANAISELLLKTGLNLPFKYALSFNEIYTAVPENNSIFHQIYVDWDAFYIKDPNVKCDYVLKQLLQAFGARIKQSKGYWIIEEVTKSAKEHTRITSSFTSETYNPLKQYTGKDDITPNRLFIVDREGDLSINPAYKRIDIHHDFLKKTSILANYNFKKYYEIPAVLNDGDAVNNKWLYPYNWTNFGRAELSHIARLNVVEGTFKVTNSLGGDISNGNVRSDFVDIEGTYYRVGLTVEYASYNFPPDTSLWIQVHMLVGSTMYYLNAAKQWVTSVASIFIDGGDSPLTHANPFTTYSIESDQIPGPGKLRVVLGMNASGGQFYKSVNVQLVSNRYDLKVYSDVNFTVEINENNNYVPEQIESILGDVPDILDKENIYAGMFWRKVTETVLVGGAFIKIPSVQENYIPTLLWSSDGQAQNATILQCLAELIADTHFKPSKYLTGLKLKGNFDFDSSFQIDFLENSKFIPIHWDCNDKYCTWTVDAVEVIGSRVLGTETGDDYLVTEDNDYILL